MTCIVAGSYFSSFTPITNMGASAEGADMTTFLAPPFRWAPALSNVVNTPVDSTTNSAPVEPQGIVAGSLLWVQSERKEGGGTEGTMRGREGQGEGGRGGSEEATEGDGVREGRMEGEGEGGREGEEREDGGEDTEGEGGGRRE